MSFVAGLGAWDALALVFFILISLLAFGMAVFWTAISLYTSEYPKAWQRKHKIAYRIGEIIIAIPTVIMCYYAFQELRPLAGTALSGGGIHPDIGTIMWAKAGMPCMFLAGYEVERWKPLNTGIKLGIKIELGTKFFFAVAAIYLALTFGRQLARPELWLI